MIKTPPKITELEPLFGDEYDRVVRDYYAVGYGPVRDDAPNGTLFSIRETHYVWFSDGSLYRATDVLKDWLKLTGRPVR